MRVLLFVSILAACLMTFLYINSRSELIETRRQRDNAISSIYGAVIDIKRLTIQLNKCSDTVKANNELLAKIGEGRE